MSSRRPGLRARRLDGGRDHAMPWVRVVASGVGVLVAYYTAPVSWADGRVGLTLLATIAGVALLAWAITGQARRQLQGDGDVDLPTLLTLVLLVTALFAWCYFALETARPGQMAGVETRTDSLYFTVQVISTVGLGDVHAVGQTARALVTAQMAFDLVFIAVAGSILASSVRSHLQQPRPTRQNRPTPPPEEP